MIGEVIFCGVVLYSMYEILTDGDKNRICNYKELNSLMGNGIMCSKNVRLSIKQSNEHILMVAPSGSGKSRRFMMHNVNNLDNCSIVVADPTGEIYKTCRTNKREYIFNPFSKNTIGYDPLKNCRNEFEVRKLAKVILTNGMVANQSINSVKSQEEWVGMATPLLSAYMLMNFYTQKYDFAEMIKNICILPIESEVERNDKGEIIKATNSIELEILMSNVESAITEFRAFKQVKRAHGTLSSIRTVLNTCLQMFFDRNVQRMFKKPDIDIGKLRQEQSVIYIQIPEHHSDYYSPLVATFLTQLFDYLLDNDGLQVYFLLDELANIGLIPSFSKLLSTARKHNISITGAIQSLTQLSTVYGELEGKQLSELFKTLLVCGGLRDSAEYISNLLGTKVYYKKETKYTEPLMTPEEIRMMDKNDMLIICNNKRPVKDKMMEILV